MGTTTGKDVDAQFFQDRSATGFVKGRSDFPNVRVPGAANPQEAGVIVAGKPWKHQKREKKEKLRRKYAHLDQHWFGKEASQGEWEREYARTNEFQ